MAIVPRNKKDIEWCGKKITITELAVSDVMMLTGFQEDSKADGEGDEETAFEQISQITKIATGLEAKEIMAQPPSQIKELMLHLEEVNAAFFWIAACFGIDKASMRSILRTQIQNKLAMASLSRSTS